MINSANYVLKFCIFKALINEIEGIWLFVSLSVESNLGPHSGHVLCNICLVFTLLLKITSTKQSDRKNFPSPYIHPPGERVIAPTQSEILQHVFVFTRNHPKSSDSPVSGSGPTNTGGYCRQNKVEHSFLPWKEAGSSVQ